MPLFMHVAHVTGATAGVARHLHLMPEQTPAVTKVGREPVVEAECADQAVHLRQEIVELRRLCSHLGAHLHHAQCKEFTESMQEEACTEEDACREEGACR